MGTRSWQTLIAAVGMCAGLVAAAPARSATFNSGSTGADGAFAPTCAPTPCTVTVALPPSGVFHFTTGTLPAGVTVQFTRNATNTPATLLFAGDVTLAGTITLDGAAGTAGVGGTAFASAGGAGGPGGFAGGAGGNGVGTTSGGAGLGPGGGTSSVTAGNCGGSGGGFGAAGANGGCAVGGPAYGTPQLLPLLGGAGGGGGGSFLGATAGAGGGGGGAILIAASGTLTYAGTISATGGAGGPAPPGGFQGGGGGAGGGVRLVATTLAGSGGNLTVAGGTASSGGAGGVGRLRLEAVTNTLTVNVNGVAPSVGPAGAVFAAGLPSLTIASVAGVAAPAAPSGAYATPDITLPSTTVSPVAVVITASAIPDGTPVVLTGKPLTGAATTATTPGLAGGTASANLALDLTQPSVISAQATFVVAAVDVPVQVAEAAGPDDPVTQVRVAAAFGGPSQVAYITRGGREIVP